MTQKTKARIALTAFLAACLIPSAGMLLLPQGEAAANQTLAPAPRLFLEDGSFNTQVLDEVTDYVADHFAFRQEMITAGAALDAAVFHVSSEEDVVLGREDWLFYRETFVAGSRGSGAAIVVWTVAIIGIITVIQFVGQKKWVNYDV